MAVINVPNYPFVDPKTGMLTPGAIGWFQDAFNLAGDANAQATPANVTTSPTPGSSLRLTVDNSAAIYVGQDYASAVNTNVVTVTPLGGSAPYSAHWSFRQGSGIAAPTNPSLLATAWTSTFFPGDNVQSIWRCTVTDAAGAQATIDIPVTIKDAAA